MPINLTLEVTDALVVAELEKLETDEARHEYALQALTVGVLAIRQASGQLDTQAITSAGERLVKDLTDLLSTRENQLAAVLEKHLAQYFDPSTGSVPLRLAEMLKEDGSIERLLKSQVGPTNSVLSATLVKHLGEGSVLSMWLSPTETSGIQQRIKLLLEHTFKEQQDRILAQFSLDDETSALSRVKNLVDSTNSAINRELTLDSEGSSLSRLRKEIKDLIDNLTRANIEFQTTVIAALESIKTSREKASKAPEHGYDFEDALENQLAGLTQQQGDTLDKTGYTPGAIPSCKKGDYVVIMGDESAAPGARIVWEAKAAGGYTLKKAQEELSEAMKNRSAQIGVFIFSAPSAPDGMVSLTRYGRQIIVVWDHEASEQAVVVHAALSIARALCVREHSETEETQQSLLSIEQCVRRIEKQAAKLNDAKTWTQTIQSNSTKLLQYIEHATEELSDSIEMIDNKIAALKAAHASV